MYYTDISFIKSRLPETNQPALAPYLPSSRYLAFVFVLWKIIQVSRRIIPYACDCNQIFNAFVIVFFLIQISHSCLSGSALVQKKEIIIGILEKEEKKKKVWGHLFNLLRWYF